MNKTLLASWAFFVILFQIANAQTPTWTSLGPIPFPQKTVSQVHGIGRCSELKFHATNPNKMYTVSASGGLWYSSNKGITWTNLGTDNINNVQSASIAVDPTNDQVIYWGTGDANYYSSGVGVYKTTNGGASWTLSNSGMGNRLVIEMLLLPTDNQTILAATNGGIYKSTNGGNTWTLRSTATAMYDMVFKPGTNGQTVYAAAAKGFYRSTDAGNTWTQITSSAFVFGANGTRVAVSAANPNIVYVGNVGAGTLGEIYKSTDGGTTFVNARSELTKCLAGYDAAGGGQGNYNFDIEANPANADELYVCAHVIWRSTDGGSTWTQQQTSWAYNLHTDQHHILFDPYVSGQLWNANDGGVWSNTTNGTGAWTPKSDGIAATEIYKSASSNLNATINQIGTQDNGEFYSSNGLWYNNRGGDFTTLTTFDYGTNYVYYMGVSTSGRRNLPGGGQVGLNFPFTLSGSNGPFFGFTPAAAARGFVSNGSTGLYRTTNLSATTLTWTQTNTLSARILSIACSPTNANVVYVFTADGKIAVSTNANAATPTFITKTGPVASATSGILVATVKDNVVYLAVGTKVYRSNNSGNTWTDISSGFPSSTINGLVYDRFSTNEGIYASYALGVYYKDTTRTTWLNYSSGLPIVSDITQLMCYNPSAGNGVIRVSYYGRGVWESPMVNSTNDITVSLTAPLNNATYTSPATVNLSATATSASGITKVEFYNGTTLLGSDATAPYSFTWTPVGAGLYNLSAVAYNSSGTSKTSSGISITVNLICNPLTGTSFGTSPAYAAGSEFDKAFDGNINTFFDFNSASGGYTGIDLGVPTVITGIRFYPRSGWASRMNGGIFQASNVANFSSGVVNLYTIPGNPNSDWNEVSVLNGTAYRYVRYFSAPNGNCNVAEIQFCGTSNQAPTVSITAPANNAVFPTTPATINITANASDADGTISKVEFYNGTTLLGSDNSSPFSYNWTGVGAGTYQLTAKAYDNLNAVTTSSAITIIAGNQNPIVTITLPANGASFAQPAAITINATATDPDGIISKVEFYNGTTLLTTDNSSPYSYVWSGVTVGNYQLTAKAYDNSTGIATSSIINVSVGNQNPTVLITTPSSGSNFTAPGSITINALAADIDGTISKVEFYDGTTLLGTDATSPYSYNWTGVALGTYTITAKAYDNASTSMTSAAVTINVTNGCSAASWNSSTIYLGDAGLGTGKGEIVSYNGRQYRALWWTQNNVPTAGGPWADLGACGTVNQSPTTTITAPINNATFTPPATIIITATASDPDGTIAKVQFYQGTTLLGQATSSPYTFTWNSVPAGTYQLTAVATDNSGATGTSGQITLIVNQAPVVTLTAPANNAVYSTAPASVTITANASSSTGTITKVEFYNGFTLLGTSTTSPYTYNWTGVASGTYTITARAYDNLGVTTTSSAVSIRVNQSPTVSISSPVNNSVFASAPATIAINATATDTDGTISKVEFYNGTALLGTSTTSPYSFNWTNVGTGSYTLTAKAYDNNGTITISSGITVIVNKIPIVNITAPANNAVYSTTPATVSITGTATDTDGTISKVEFFNGTILLGNSTSSPYTYAWDNVASGTYTITAKAYDNNGGTATSSAITIVVNKAPVVSITAPANNAVYTAPASVAITASASDADGTIGKVEFYNGSTLLGTSTSSPYSYSWTNVASGTYSLTAKAYDNNGGITTSSAIMVIVNANAAPTVSITAPANNAVYTDVPATVALTATATDTDGTISKVEFYNGTTLLGTDNSSPYSYTWTGVAAGTYSITAKAFDDLNATTTSSAVTVIVNTPTNNAPSVSITTPVNNSSYTAPATVTINATATDADGSISKVEFYNGTTLLGTSTTSPYSYTWSGAGAGTYSLTAKAYDNLNATATSSVVTVTVNNNSLPVVSITSPLNNTAFIAPASVAITAAATDADGTISKVEFYNGTILLGVSTSSPYTYNWTGVTAGAYSLTAKAYDNLNAVATSSAISITVSSNTLPIVSITAPSNSANFVAPATITITANASDPDGTISKVEFYNGAALLGTSTSNPYSFNWINVVSGTYSLTAKAYDNLNAATTSATIMITVNNNQAPIVSITSPSNNASYIAPASIAITASASDFDGSISKVEFYHGEVLIGTTTNSPYTYTATNVAAGTYLLTVKAYDNLNANATSSAITVVVNGCSYNAWKSNSIYTVGNRCERNGNVYEAKWWTQNNDPLTNSGQYDVWKLLGACGTNLMPSLMVTTTAANDTLPSPANFAVSITSHDDEGYVAKVEIYNLNNLVSQYFSGSATYDFKDLPIGYYEIYVKAYDDQGNMAISDTLKFLVQSPLTGIFNPVHSSKLTIYPNPVTGKELNVEYPANQNGPVSITIIDLNGKELLSFKDSKNGGGQTEVLNVGSLQPGMYILKMNIGGKEYEEKVQKASKPKMK